MSVNNLGTSVPGPGVGTSGGRSPSSRFRPIGAPGSVSGGWMYEIFQNSIVLNEAAALALVAPPEVSDLSYDGLFIRAAFTY